MSNVLAIVNQKGGVGKTTSSIYLAKALSQMNHSVLLVDFDPLSHTPSRLEVKDQNRGLLSLLKGETDVDHSVIHVGNTFDLLTADQDVMAIEVMAMKCHEREQILSSALLPVRLNYDYIVIDAPSSLGLLTLNALAASDAVLIPIRCDYFSYEGIAELLRTVSDVCKNLNSRLKVLGFVITHVFKELRSTPINIHDIRRCFDGMVFDSMVYEDDELDKYYSKLANEIVPCF